MRSEIVKLVRILWLTHKLIMIVSAACWFVGFQIFTYYLSAKNYYDLPLCFIGFFFSFLSGIFFNNALRGFHAYRDMKTLLRQFDEKKN